MSAQLLNGQALAESIQHSLKYKVARLEKTPCLAVVLVGDNPASVLYVNKKREACKAVGIKSVVHRLPYDTSQEILLNLIASLNHSVNVQGILVQLPLPEQINTLTVLQAISPQKDVDGFHPFHLGKLAQGDPIVRPCTPYGIIRLIQHYQIPLRGKHAVVVGASTVVGRPMMLEFLLAGCTVTICHKLTHDLKKHVSEADILVSAIGKTNVIKSDWIKPGSIVIDVGINRIGNHEVVGDIDFKTAKEKASFITPVPGGVGPMTVAMLLENTFKSAYNL